MIGIGTSAVAGSAVSVLVRVNSTVASAPGASGPYGLEAASAVKFAGSASDTVPLCSSSDQLWTSTGIVFVSPSPIDVTAAERPTRSARGAVSVSQLSYSFHLPQRWKRPSTGETTRATVSV